MTWRVSKAQEVRMSKAPSVRSVPGALMSTAQQGEVSKESWEGKENCKALALSEKTQAGPEQNDVLSSLPLLILFIKIQYLYSE